MHTQRKHSGATRPCFYIFISIVPFLFLYSLIKSKYLSYGPVIDENIFPVRFIVGKKLSRAYAKVNSVQVE
jgi:hypothetical protein